MMIVCRTNKELSHCTVFMEAYNILIKQIVFLYHSVIKCYKIINLLQ